MSVTLDSEALFDGRDLRIEVGSCRRACVEQTVCGLDGMLSIDLGQRARTIRQHGTLHAASRAAMRMRIDAIAAFMDGSTHILRTADGRQYGNLRMDSFTQSGECVDGPGIVVEYKIVYTQLGVS